MQKIRRPMCALLAVLLLFPLLLCSCGNQMEKAVGTCAGYDVLYEELRYVTLTYKDIFEATYGKGIWNDPATAETYREELRETVGSVMLNNYAVLAACNEYMLTQEDLESETIQASVDSQIADAVEEYGGRDAFEEALEKLYMTEHFLRFCLSVAALENELLYVLTEDLDMFFAADETEEFYDWLKDGNCVYVQHIFLRNDSEEEKAANRTLAAEVVQKLRSGEKTVNDYINSPVNEDLNNVSPYFMVKDVYTEKLEKAGFALAKAGDVSDPVETEDGFYILVRMNYDDLTLLSAISGLLKSYQWAKLEAFIDTYREKIKLEWNDYGAGIDLLTIE